MDDRSLAVLRRATDAAVAALSDLDDWTLVGRDHAAQYNHDIVADDAIVPSLLADGVAVLSEESGRSGPTDAEITVVVDPVDGSTNASLGLPHWVVAMCAYDADGPVAAIVHNPSNGERFEAVRGQGATLNGSPIRPSDTDMLSRCVVSLSGNPPKGAGWAQVRILGAAALDLCYVACGRLDGFVASYGLSIWDYSASALICVEAGAQVAELRSVDLYDLTNTARRQIVAASTPRVLDGLRSAVR